MKRGLVVARLIGGCGSDGATNVTPPPVRYVLYVDGAQTGIPGPYCVVTISNPTFLTLHSLPNVVYSAVATLHVAPGRSLLEWQADSYNAGGPWVLTLNSHRTDITSLPSSSYFVCLAASLHGSSLLAADPL